MAVHREKHVAGYKFMCYLCGMKKNCRIESVDAILDQKYGKVGTRERKQFRREAYAYCFGAIGSGALSPSDAKIIGAGRLYKQEK